MTKPVLVIKLEGSLHFNKWSLKEAKLSYVHRFNPQIRTLLLQVASLNF